MKTLDQRIKWILANRPKFKNQTDLVRKAELSEGLLGSAKSREKQNPTFQISHESAAAIAAVANVDATWLRTGEGVPDSSYGALAHLDTNDMRNWAASLLAEIEHIDPKEASWIMTNLPPPKHPTREAFLIAGFRRFRKEDDGTEGKLSEGHVANFTEQLLRRRSKQKN